ncbi:hypothetical protein WJ972_24390 [Achromobacter insuavis]
MQRHGSLAQACAAWGGCAGGNDNAVEFPVPGQQQPLYESGLAQLRSGIARRVSAWFGSDAKVDLRERDFLLFLAATDQAYFERLRRVVHESTDARVPVTGTQMGYGGLLNFDSQVAMDYIDEHFYVGHPDIRANDDWRIPDLTASGNEFDRVLALSLRRDAKRPFVVSEFNQPFPNPRGAEILPLMSAVGALQDWDGLFYFDYSDAQRLPQSPSRFALSGDWGAWRWRARAPCCFASRCWPRCPTRSPCRWGRSSACSWAPTGASMPSPPAWPTAWAQSRNGHCRGGWG